MTDLNQPAYRWVVVIASALILAVSMGAIVNGITAFVVPMQEAFGWQRGTVSLINFSGIIGLAFGGMVMGRVADKRGVRPVVLFGAVMLGLTYILASFMHEPWQFYALFVFGGFFGAGAIFAPVMAAVGGWFRLGAGLAIGIASAGRALGQGGVPFGSTFLISGFGLSGAFMATGIIMLVVLVPLALLLRPAPAQTATAAAQTAMDEQDLPPVKTLIAWMSPAVVLCCTCMSVPLMHLVPLLQDKGLVRQVYGSRVERYEHLLAQSFSLTQPQIALVGLLLLRGPQTAHELLARSERLARFGSMESLDTELDLLIGRRPPLVKLLERAPGQREERYAHLLSGDVQTSVAVRAAPERAVPPGFESRLQALEEQVACADLDGDSARETLDGIDASRITIAHRLSTVRNADRICVLERGRFVESGTFADLMARDGAFATLARRQLLED